MDIREYLNIRKGADRHQIFEARVKKAREVFDLVSAAMPEAKTKDGLTVANHAQLLNPVALLRIVEHLSSKIIGAPPDYGNIDEVFLDDEEASAQAPSATIASAADAIRRRFKAMPAGPERTAFYHRHREVILGE